MPRQSIALLAFHLATLVWAVPMAIKDFKSVEDMVRAMESHKYTHEEKKAFLNLLRAAKDVKYLPVFEAGLESVSQDSRETAAAHLISMDYPFKALIYSPDKAIAGKAIYSFRLKDEIKRKVEPTYSDYFEFLADNMAPEHTRGMALRRLETLKLDGETLTRIKGLIDTTSSNLLKGYAMRAYAAHYPEDALKYVDSYLTPGVAPELAKAAVYVSATLKREQIVDRRDRIVSVLGENPNMLSAPDLPYGFNRSRLFSALGPEPIEKSFTDPEALKSFKDALAQTYPDLRLFVDGPKGKELNVHHVNLIQFLLKSPRSAGNMGYLLIKLNPDQVLRATEITGYSDGMRTVVEEFLKTKPRREIRDETFDKLREFAPSANTRTVKKSESDQTRLHAQIRQALGDKAVATVAELLPQWKLSSPDPELLQSVVKFAETTHDANLEMVCVDLLTRHGHRDDLAASAMAHFAKKGLKPELRQKAGKRFLKVFYESSAVPEVINAMMEMETDREIISEIVHALNRGTPIDAFRWDLVANAIKSGHDDSFYRMFINAGNKVIVPAFAEKVIPLLPADIALRYNIHLERLADRAKPKPPPEPKPVVPEEAKSEVAEGSQWPQEILKDLERLKATEPAVRKDAVKALLKAKLPSAEKSILRNQILDYAENEPFLEVKKFVLQKVITSGPKNPGEVEKRAMEILRSCSMGARTLEGQ